MPLHVETVPVPTDPANPHPWLADWLTIEAAHYAELTGHNDLVESVESAAESYRSQDTTRSMRLIAFDGEQAVGAAHVWMPLQENRTLGYALPHRLPGVDEQPVYEALWRKAEPLLRDMQRTVIHCWTTHPPPQATARTITPTNGVGRLGEDGRAWWLQRAGFVLEQVQRYNVLHVSAETVALSRALIQGTHVTGSSYSVRSWTGSTPAELVEGMAALHSRMSVDVPRAGLDGEQEEWDEARVRRRDEKLAAARLSVVSTVALDSHGAPVAYTDLTAPWDSSPAVAFQDGTFVHGRHRGHRLGVLVKAANILALRQHLPEVVRVHTWNAEENTHMLASTRSSAFVPRE